MAQVIQLRRDTAANWTTANPILAVGEIGLETDTSKMKVGDGATVWADLAYFAGAGGGVGNGGGLGAWKFNTTTSAPPASGTFRVNSATPASITTLWVHDTNDDGVDLSNFLGRLEADDYLYVQQEDDSTKAMLFEIDSVTDDGTHYTYGVTYVDSGSGGLWQNNRRCGVLVIQEPPTASDIPFTPYGDIAADNVQAAIEELEDEKLNDVVDDTTPTLGGDLDADYKEITNVDRVSIDGTAASPTYTSLDLTGFIDTANVKTYDFANIQMPSIVYTHDTRELNLSANVLGMSYLFWHTTLYKNKSSSGNIGLAPAYTLVGQPKFQADGKSLSMILGWDVFISPTLDAISGGSLAVTTYEHYAAGITINASVTVTTRRGYKYTEAAVNGTLENQAGFSTDDLNNATNNTHILLGTATVPAGDHLIYQANDVPNRWNAGQTWGYAAITASLNLGTGTNNEKYHVIHATSGTLTVTLPLATVGAGREYVFRNDSGNNLTIARSGSDTINSAAANATVATGGYARYVSDGVADWFQTG